MPFVQIWLCQLCQICHSVFTLARVGYHARVYIKGQLLFEYTQPDIPCEDVKACYIIKGGNTC